MPLRFQRVLKLHLETLLPGFKTAGNLAACGSASHRRRNWQPCRAVSSPPIMAPPHLRDTQFTYKNALRFSTASANSLSGWLCKNAVPMAASFAVGARPAAKR